MIRIKTIERRLLYWIYRYAAKNLVFFVTFQKLRIIYKEKMRRTVYVAE